LSYASLYREAYLLCCQSVHTVGIRAPEDTPSRDHMRVRSYAKNSAKNSAARQLCGGLNRRARRVAVKKEADSQITKRTRFQTAKMQTQSATVCRDLYAAMLGRMLSMSRAFRALQRLDGDEALKRCHATLEPGRAARARSVAMVFVTELRALTPAEEEDKRRRVILIFIERIIFIGPRCTRKKVKKLKIHM
jgi:hypothetical protein